MSEQRSCFLHGEFDDLRCPTCVMRSVKQIKEMIDGPPTLDEIAAARNVLERLVNTGDLDASDVRRAQDGMRMLNDSCWRYEEDGKS